MNKRRKKYSETNVIKYFLRGTAYYLTSVPGSSHLVLQSLDFLEKGQCHLLCPECRVGAGLCCPGRR